MTGTSIPRNLIFVDVMPVRVAVDETDWREARRFGLGVAVHCRISEGKLDRWEKLVFHDPYRYWDWVDKWLDPKRGLWIVGWQLGHSLRLLDFFGLLSRGHFKLKEETGKPAGHTSESQVFTGTLVAGERTTLLITRRRKTVVKCVDLRNYFDRSLRELAEWVGRDLPGEPGDAAERTQWEEWLSARVWTAAEAFEKLAVWWEREDLGGWKFTAAGLAMSAYRHRFLPKGILIDGHQEATALARAAIVGGDVRCFFIGTVTPEHKGQPGRLYRTKGFENRWRVGPVTEIDVTSF